MLPYGMRQIPRNSTALLGSPDDPTFWKPPKSQEAAVGESRTYAAGPHSIWLFAALRGKCDDTENTFAAFESGNGDRRGPAEEGGGHILVTLRGDKADEKDHRLTPSSNSLSLARASVRRGPVDRHCRDEGLFALICGEMHFCHNVAMRAIQIYVASDGLRA